MKKTILCVMLICIAIASHAGGNELDPYDVLSIRPQVSTKNDLEKLFGKPDKYVETNEQGQWKYETSDMTITFIWDTKTAKVERYNIHSVKVDREKWLSKNAQHFHVGISTPKDIIERLGLPNDMYSETKSSQLKYYYQNIALSLRFKEGVLSGFYVEQQTKS
jgi:hypothetical protein